MGSKKRQKSKEEKAKQKLKTEANKERRRQKHLERFPDDKQSAALFGRGK